MAVYAYISTVVQEDFGGKPDVAMCRQTSTSSKQKTIRKVLKSKYHLLIKTFPSRIQCYYQRDFRGSFIFSVNVQHYAPLDVPSTKICMYILAIWNPKKWSPYPKYLCTCTHDVYQYLIACTRSRNCMNVCECVRERAHACGART